MSDYIVQFKVKNGPLLNTMRLKGFNTAAEFSRVCGVSQQQLGRYLNLKEPPIGKRGEWTEAVNRMALVLQVLPENLFPVQHYEKALKKNTGEADFSLADLKLLYGATEAPSAEQLMIEGQEKTDLMEVLDTLASREKKHLCLYYGLDGNDSHILEDMAQKEGITRERVRQIIKKGLRKLRHPSRAKLLRKL